MLDAYIIDKVKKQDSQKEWEPTPLTLELPVSEKEQTDKPEEPEKKKEDQVTFHF